MENLFLTRKEVSELLGISDRTISRKIKSGKLKVVVKNKKQLFPREQFSELETKEANVYDTLVSALQKQIETLEKEIEVKNQQIEKLQISLNNQQGLTKDITDKILSLPEPKKSIIKRIFRK